MSRALAELNQGQAQDVGAPGNEAEKVFDERHARWLAEATVENQPYLRPAESRQRVASDFVDRSTGDVRDDLIASIELLRGKDLEMIVQDYTRPDLGFPVARVVVPGLRHFWGRYAPGRLYDVPVKLGWVDRPRAESELNPIPFFL